MLFMKICQQITCIRIDYISIHKDTFQIKEAPIWNSLSQSDTKKNFDAKF